MTSLQKFDTTFVWNTVYIHTASKQLRHSWILQLICISVVYMCRRNPHTQSQALDSELVDRNNQRTEGQGSSRSADSDDVEDTRTTSTVRRHPSLIRCLLRVYGLSLLKAHLCKLVCDVLLFVGPVLQKWVQTIRVPIKLFQSFNTTIINSASISSISSYHL